jgi:hypothetical protein
MKIMNKTPFEVTMTGHLREASNALADFLSSHEDRVFVLKGPYGAGKSYFLRWFLTSEKGRESSERLKFLSYVSVFGVNDLKELQNVMVGSITLRALGSSSLLKTGIFDKTLNLIQKGISPILGGLNLELSAGSAIWSIAKHQGLLLVIDDVDRKGSSLPLDSIIGFANSLAEHSDSRTKVIFVLNEEQFSDEESAIWTKLREKFIDNEFRFHPSAVELAGLFVDDASVRDLIGRIHSRLNKPNIRSMRKIQSMARRLAEYLKELQVFLDQSEIAHAIRCAALYLHSGVRIVGDDLFKIYSKNRYIRDSDPPSDQEKSLYALMASIEFGPDSNMDSPFFAFFRDGSVDPEVLATFVKNRMDEKTRERFEKDQQDLRGSFNANFQNNEAEYIEKARTFLEDYRNSIGIQDIEAIVENLEALGEVAFEEWRLWLELRLPNLDHGAIQRLRPIVPKSLHAMLDARKRKIDSVSDPTSVFKELNDNGLFGTPETIAELAKWTEDDFLKWFASCVDPDLFSQLRAYLQVNYSSDTPELLSIRNVLAGALRKQGDTSRFNALRIRKIFGDLIKEAEHSPEQVPSNDSCPL